MDPNAPIMIVGSDASFCYLMRRYVTQSAYAAASAYFGEDILAMALREPPIAILLEADPPLNRGWELLQALKANAVTRSIPIVLCAWPEQAEEDLCARADSYLTKPVLYGDFLEAMAQIGIVEKRSAQAAS